MTEMKRDMNLTYPGSGLIMTPSGSWHCVECLSSEVSSADMLLDISRMLKSGEMASFKLQKRNFFQEKERPAMFRSIMTFNTCDTSSYYQPDTVLDIADNSLKHLLSRVLFENKRYMTQCRESHMGRCLRADKA